MDFLRLRNILVTFVSVHLVVGCTTMYVYADQFNYPHAIIVIHAFSMIMGLLGVAWLVYAIHIAEGFNVLPVRTTSSVICTLFSSSLAFLYFINFLSNHFWGQPVDLPSIIGLVSHFREYSRLASVSLTAPLTGGAIGILALFWIYYRAFGVVGASPVHRAPGAGSSARTHWFRAGMLLTGLLIFSAVSLAVIRESNSYFGDPILTIATRHGSAAPLDPLQISMIEENRRAREEYAPSRPREAPNVILVMSDSLRPDHMSVYGYERQTTPFLKRFVERTPSRLFPLALTVCPSSACSIVSTLTSKAAHMLAPNDISLPEALKAHGYRTYMITAGDHSAWGVLRAFYEHQQLDLFVDGLIDDRFGVTDDQMVLSHVEALPPAGERPSFLFLFLMSSHIAGEKHDEYTIYQPAELSLPRWWSNDAIDPLRHKNHYDNGVRQADGFLERIFAHLDEKGYLDNSIVVITSDHGEGLGEHGAYLHGSLLYQEFLHVPLIVSDPGISSYRGDGPVTLLDIAPTVIDRIGGNVPSTWQGCSLLQPPSGQVTVHQYGDRQIRRAILHESGEHLYKLIVTFDISGAIQSSEIYDLNQDPAEKRDLAADLPDSTASRLWARFDAAYAAPHASASLTDRGRFSCQGAPATASGKVQR